MEEVIVYSALCLILLGILAAHRFLHEFTHDKLIGLQDYNHGTLEGLHYSDFLNLGCPDSTTITNNCRTCTWKDDGVLGSMFHSTYLITIRFDEHDRFVSIISQQWL